MAADVRINQVDTDLTATDASALLSPKTLERIVEAVLARLSEKRQAEDEAERERSLGTLLRQDAERGM